jgi:hypothetical protein
MLALFPGGREGFSRPIDNEEMEDA